MSAGARARAAQESNEARLEALERRVAELELRAGVATEPAPAEPPAEPPAEGQPAG